MANNTSQKAREIVENRRSRTTGILGSYSPRMGGYNGHLFTDVTSAGVGGAYDGTGK